jgi:hypothetical protein
MMFLVFVYISYTDEGLFLETSHLIVTVTGFRNILLCTYHPMCFVWI